MTNEQFEAYAKVIRDFKPSQEYIEKLIQDRKDFEAYMALEEHDGDCYCYRCMSEFLSDK